MSIVDPRHPGFHITTDPAAIDVDAVHAYLTRSYWARGIPRDVVARAIQGSLCFGVFQGDRQVGFARVVTDRATFGYLCDVYTLEEVRGQGLGKWVVEVVVAHPDLQGLRRLFLGTRDAHGLYTRYGFKPLARPEIFLEINHPDLYVTRAGPGG